MKRISPELRKLIIVCSSNIKGWTKKEEIEKLLPIKSETLEIAKNDRNITIIKNGNVLGNVWENIGCYSNLEILKIITKEFNIEPKSERILELMKYKYLIDNVLVKVGE